jgi:hypothetical protein
MRWRCPKSGRPVEMNSPVWQNPWRLMLVVNIAVVIGVFLHKLTLPPYIPYVHLLVDYHFGFTKRALIGAIISLVTFKVPEWLVYALAATAWLLTAALFVHLFRRIFGFCSETMPILVLMAGSPFFLKNFMFTLGHFDIYGCAVALCLLLAPARSIAFVIAAALASMALILIHHIQILMYVPTIAVIVMLRYYFVQGLSRHNLVVGIGAMLAIGILFVAAQVLGTVTVPPAEFVAYLDSRIADPSRDDLLRYSHGFAYIWYQPLSKEIQDTWDRMPSNLLGVPVYALLIWLHAPLWKYFHALVDALADDRHRRLVIAAIAGVSLGYLVIFAMVFDYSRWVSNWAVCLFLILLAVKDLPMLHPVPPIPTEARKTQIFGWLVTLIPRVGVVRPF